MDESNSEDLLEKCLYHHPKLVMDMKLFKDESTQLIDGKSRDFKGSTMFPF